MKSLAVLCALTSVAAAQPAEVVQPVPPGPLVIRIVPGYGPASCGPVAQPPFAPPGAPPGAPSGASPFAPPGASPAHAPRQKKRARTPRRPSGALGVNPVGWLMDTYGASAWFALGDHSAVRIDGTLFSWEIGYESYEAEVTVPLYPLRTFRGPFVEPGFSLRRTRGYPFTSDLEFDSIEGSQEPRQRHLKGPTLLFGWHWLLGDRAHAAAAIGVAILEDSRARYDARESTTNGYLRLGVTF